VCVSCIEILSVTSKVKTNIPSYFRAAGELMSAVGRHDSSSKT